MESGAIFNALMIIGFLGVVWLMIYGNLSGNLGFTDESLSFINQTINLTSAGETPAGADNRVSGSLSNVVVRNSTCKAGATQGCGELVAIGGNYSITGVVIANVTDSPYFHKNVNVTYTVTFTSQGEVDSDSIIENLTGGTKTYFAFFPTILTITAIVLLITILIGLLFLVISIFSKFSGGKKSGEFSG